MPSFKLSDEDIDIDALEEAEYTEQEEFASYDGDIPPKGTILNGYVKTVWYTRTQADDPMLKVLFEAAENTGDNKQYDGLPFWENLALTPSSKFRWKPLIDQFVITLKDIKTKFVAVSEEDDQFGTRLSKIGKFTIGADSDEAWARVVTVRERYNGDWQAHVGKWLDWEEPDADEDEDEPEVDVEEEEPEDAAIDEEEAEEDLADEDNVDEDNVEEEDKPARGRRSGTKTASTKAAKPAAAKTATRAKAPVRGQRTAKAATSKATPAKAAPARGRGRRAAGGGDDTEPPF